MIHSVRVYVCLPLGAQRQWALEAYIFRCETRGVIEAYLVRCIGRERLRKLILLDEVGNEGP